MRMRSRRAVVVLVLVLGALLTWSGLVFAQNEGTVVINGLNSPMGVLVGPDSNVWVIDSGTGGEEAAASESVTETVPAAEPGSLDIVDTALAAGSFRTLVSAIQEKGLEETLRDTAQTFTVFAPSDSAFQALSVSDRIALYRDADTLTDVLLHHVVSGTYTSADLADGDSLTTLLGDTLSVRVENGNVYVDDVQVTSADVLASNGVIHVLEGVLQPASGDEAAAGEESASGEAAAATEAPAEEEAVATEAPAEEAAATAVPAEEPVATEAPAEEPAATAVPAEEAAATEAPVPATLPETGAESPTLALLLTSIVVILLLGAAMMFRRKRAA